MVSLARLPFHDCEYSLEEDEIILPSLKKFFFCMCRCFCYGSSSSRLNLTLFHQFSLTKKQRDRACIHCRFNKMWWTSNSLEPLNGRGGVTLELDLDHDTISLLAGLENKLLLFCFTGQDNFPTLELCVLLFSS